MTKSHELKLIPKLLEKVTKKTLKEKGVFKWVPQESEYHVDFNVEIEKIEDCTIATNF